MRAVKSHTAVPPEEAPEPPVSEVPSAPRDPRAPLAIFLGAGKGCFESAEQIDAFLRGERDSWRP